MSPNIFTIAPDRPFLATLASGILAQSGGDPLYLPRVTILLPTRRAVRALRETFLRLDTPERAAGAPLLLPRLQAIGDLDSDDLIPADGTAESLDLPPAISELRRRLLLTQLVMRWSEQAGEPLLAGQAAALAGALARFLDAVATEGADFARLADLVPENHAAHWQIVQRFLAILPNAWPPILAAEGALDPAERRNRLLARQARLWREEPPQSPVIAAGLTGGVPAIEELLVAVAALDQGAVVLPGLERFYDDENWAAIAADEAHPQHLLASLLDALGVAPIEVRDWPAALATPFIASEGGSRRELLKARTRLVAEALRPSATTHVWRQLQPASADDFAMVSRHDCATVADEALTIALLLRRKLEVPSATAALVTPDRELARRVAAELRRWGIEIDDSAGLPLSRTPIGAFLRLLLECVESDFAPVSLCALLKHPFAAGGLAPEMFRDRARRLEMKIRGPRPAPGLAGLRAAIGDRNVALNAFVDRIESCLGKFAAIVSAETTSLAELVARHVEAAERLAASATQTGSERLWREDAGEAAARFLHEFAESASGFPPLPGRHYGALFEALAAGAVVRPRYGRHPRLFIWGLLEARLQHADLVVLGGLNEGTWPATTEHDPWMSRQMRREFGLSVPERAIGLAAHDFVSALGGSEVALTRSARREGAPTVPSRWLLRLDAVLQAVGLADALTPDAAIVAAAELLDNPPKYRPLQPPEPRPPLAARPRQLSVTQVETWLRDPYAIYARHILALKALEELDADPSRADLGNLIHEALDRFVKLYPRALPAEPEPELLRLGRECFGALLSRPGVWAFWWPRLERIARWLVAEEARYRTALCESLAECEGRLVIASPGGPFTLVAKADRIDRLKAGGLALVDYKTGSLPTTKDIERGIAPQLPLEGAILRDGDFGGVSGPPVALEYWRLGGGIPAGERRPIGAEDPLRLVDLVLGRLKRLIAVFDDPATPYYAVPAPQWAPRYSDYRHLERIEESEAEE